MALWSLISLALVSKALRACCTVCSFCLTGLRLETSDHRHSSCPLQRQRMTEHYLAIVIIINVCVCQLVCSNVATMSAAFYLSTSALHWYLTLNLEP